MLYSLKRFFTKLNSYQQVQSSMVASKIAAKAYLDARVRLELAKGFHVVHYFGGDSFRFGDYPYKLEGDAIAWKIIKFEITGHPTKDGEWLTKLTNKINLYKIGEITLKRRSGQLNINTLSYRKTDGKWQEVEKDAYEGEFILVFDVLGHRWRAIRDIEYQHDEIFEGENCKFYDWSLEAGGYYKLWISKSTHNIVCIEQIHPWGSTKTIFSKIDEPVDIEEPE